MSAACPKIVRQWCHWGLCCALLWMTAQLPVPVLHAHGRHPAAPHELPLGQHMEWCHGDELVADFLDWHIHWFSPQTLLKGLGETPGGTPEDSRSPCGCPTLGTLELILGEFIAWASSVGDAGYELSMRESQYVSPTHTPVRHSGVDLSWYGSPHSRLCQMQTWLC